MKTSDSQQNHTQELAKKIFEDLNKKGAGLGNFSEILIQGSIEKHFPNLEKAVTMHEEFLEFIKRQISEGNFINDGDLDEAKELVKKSEHK